MHRPFLGKPVVSSVPFARSLSILQGELTTFSTIVQPFALSTGKQAAGAVVHQKGLPFMVWQSGQLASVLNLQASQPMPQDDSFIGISPSFSYDKSQRIP
jgi:hypothetical protein